MMLLTNNLKDKEKHNKKIRKRGCSSSTSSSSSPSFVTRYRFKRAILVGKKSGYSTPPPVWKTTTSMHHHHNTKTANPSSGFKEKQLTVFSARKLAATLWEINDFHHSSRVKKNGATRSSKERDRDRVVSSSDPLYSPFSEVKEKIEGFDVDGCKRKGSDFSHQLQLADYYLKDLDAHCNADLIEKANNKPKEKKKCGKCMVGLKNHLKEARSGLSTSKKLLKVLSQKCLQEQDSSSIPLILAMSSELDRVRNEIDHLIQEQSSNHNDIESLMKHFAEEKNAWKRREREKIREATMSIAQELDVEKKLRRQTERLNEKISKEMSYVKASYSKMSKELEREKRAKEILEQVCDELAKGIGEDKAQAEEMKRESEKIREEFEKEREMLQLADVLREERVHMKLSEAKYQFEEKNAVLEKLTNELENFFKSKEEEKGDVNPGLKKLKELESYLNTTLFQNLEQENGLNVRNGLEHEDESGESDLESIELCMDNDNKSYQWSYACENFILDEANRVSIDRDIGRRSISDWGSICFNKGTANAKKRDFISDQFERERSVEFVFGSEIQKDNKGSESYNNRPIMSLRDYMSCPDSAQESGKPLSLLCHNGKAGENALALEGCS